MTSISLFSLLFFSISWACSKPVHENFMQCMSNQLKSGKNHSQIIYSSSSPQFPNLLQSSQQNPRWSNSTSVLKPLFIITPFHESQVQASVICSRRHGLQVRVRSGGHDYEGLSYLSKSPFVVIDLVDLRSVDVNIKDETAWVQSGATLGELYYAISKASKVHGFPAGICPSVGVGGHFSGGGFGTMLRKHGLAADNVLDAHVVDSNGRILERKTMSEGLFWAIRGGGGGNFGIVVSWKIKLVRVPHIVTGFTVSKTLAQGASLLVHKWQYIADKLHEDLFIRIILQNVGEGNNQKTVQASFNSLFLGGKERLVQLMKERFPELGLQARDCIEMSWIQSVLYIAGYNKDQPLEVLLDRETLYKSKFKAKSDFVNTPIPEVGFKGIWDMFSQEEVVFMIMDPFGGKMNEISEFETPFPHRKGNLYNIQYMVKWDADGVGESNKHLRWIRVLYWYMRPHVTRSPRGAYVNYRDLDLGTNNLVKKSYQEARTWGVKYFKGNFERLARVKNKVDPDNFFRNEQSIPPLPSLL
ncbi:hypothetical protein TIFTF001_033496 [Ficus carica]|uniref:FAD-binding PCMH-type domain-containing protein n=1 Tax=Ficus carica TaxID=3494 RepID=A0AA88J996_FICCA|nr:hypothetical protein TIFTF001_033496 [Ficus carica]